MDFAPINFDKMRYLIATRCPDLLADFDIWIVFAYNLPLEQYQLFAYLSRLAPGYSNVSERLLKGVFYLRKNPSERHIGAVINILNDKGIHREEYEERATMPNKQQRYWMPPTPAAPVPAAPVPAAAPVLQYLDNYPAGATDPKGSTLYRYLQNVFFGGPGYHFIAEVLQEYGVKQVGAAVCFPYLNQAKRFCSFKMMQYKTDGHRDKSTMPQIINPVKGHTEHTDKALFGEHLITDPAAVLYIVESEKTAIMYTIWDRETQILRETNRPRVYLATGGATYLNARTNRPCLSGHTIILVPDKDKRVEWKAIADRMKWGMLEDPSTIFGTEQGDHADIADYIESQENEQNNTTRAAMRFMLSESRSQPDKREALETLIDLFGLEVDGEKRGERVVSEGIKHLGVERWQ